MVQSVTNHAQPTLAHDVPHHAWVRSARTVEPLAGGRVNDTYLVTAADGERIVLQRLNERVFPEPKVVVRNARKLADHLANRADAFAPRVPMPYRTLEGADALVTADGGVWRARTYLPGTPLAPARLDDVEAAAFAFGGFVNALQGVPTDDIESVLPGLHVLSFAVRRLERLTVAASPEQRRQVLGEVDRARRCFETVERACQLRGVASLPQRIVHNDTKLANVIVASDGLGIVDLDLTGAGTVLADVGDLVRSASGHLPDVDPARVHRAVVASWRRGAGELIIDAEVEALPVAGPLVATELALRYLADALDPAPTLRTTGAEAPRKRAMGNLGLAERLLAVMDQLLVRA
ncbi:MAG: aminoglycoside phosphotransferase family protein [Acidimicrobiales bacterium]|nr:aminoglycoside phosphotransferase family protein [Acidimicrobiales bacterium]